MPYEDPDGLRARLRLGREEFCQRLLTALILGGPYPRWNLRSVPSPRGAAFLRALDALSFGEPRWAEGAQFVDELDLPARHDAERGGAPDQAVLWPGRLWLIELKTEAGSHRRDQLPSYFALAGHHFPRVPVDVTYLTPPMTVPAPATVAPNRYAHVTWPAVAELVAAGWAGSADPAEAKVCRVLLDTLAGLGAPAATWRAGAVPAAGPPAGDVAQAAELPRGGSPDPGSVGNLVGAGDADEAVLAAARATAGDGRQRAVELDVGSLEDLQGLRLRARSAIGDAPAGSPLRHVRPWLWSAASSGGAALTGAGRVTGYELRVSRYARPVP